MVVTPTYLDVVRLADVVHEIAEKRKLPLEDAVLYVFQWLDSEPVSVFEVRPRELPEADQYVRVSDIRELEGTPLRLTAVLRKDRNALIGPSRAELDDVRFPDRTHPRVSSKFAALCELWEEFKSNPPASRGKSLKQEAIDWLTSNASRLGLLKSDGTLNKEAIESVAEVYNWQPKGGAPKTPGNDPAIATSR